MAAKKRKRSSRRSRRSRARSGRIVKTASMRDRELRERLRRQHGFRIARADEEFQCDCGAPVDVGDMAYQKIPGDAGTAPKCSLKCAGLI